MTQASFRLNFEMNSYFCTQVFDKNGTFQFMFGREGKKDGHLWLPSNVAVIRSDKRIVIADQGVERLRLQIFSKDGIFLTKIPF